MKVLSSDNHIVEPPDLFSKRVQRKFRDEAPRVTLEADGSEWWAVEDTMVLPTFISARAGDRFEPQMSRARRWSPRTWAGASFEEDVPVSAYEPTAWLAALEEDGIHGGIALPSVGMSFYAFIKDTQLLNECFRAMNDWMLEFGDAAPERIRPIMTLNLDDPEWAIKELWRTCAHGARGAMIPVRNPRGYHDAFYEKFWVAAEELDIPLLLHVATTRWPSDPHGSSDPGHARRINDRDYYVRCSLTEMIIAGVFERHPGLRVVSVENEGAWIPYFLDRLDVEYHRNMRMEGVPRFKDGLSPSDFFRRNVYISFTEDPTLIALRDVIGLGADHLTWGGDFPHAEATYPRSRPILERDLATVSDADRRAMLYSTCAALFRF